uniref:Uncharacterized protein n=1 Tax=Tetranychus urticae TaxID=32264 RepID=T1JWU2_TETUR
MRRHIRNSKHSVHIRDNSSFIPDSMNSSIVQHMVRKNRRCYGALKYDIYYEHAKFLELNKEYKHQPRNEEYVSADIHREKSAKSSGKRLSKVFKCPYCAYAATGGYKSSVMRHIHGREKPGSTERGTPACGQRKLVEPAINGKFALAKKTILISL